jgi:hypothetical protein
MKKKVLKDRHQDRPHGGPDTLAEAEADGVGYVGQISHGHVRPKML